MFTFWKKKSIQDWEAEWLNESDKYVADTYNTIVLTGQGQSNRSRLHIKKKRDVSYVFVKLMILKGELLLKGDVGPFRDQ